MAYAESVLQDPCRSGSPHGVRGSPLAAFDAVAALDPVAALCPAAGRTATAAEITRPASVHAVVTHGLLMWLSPLTPRCPDRFYRLSLSGRSSGAPVPDEPTKSFLPFLNVRSRPLARMPPSFA